MSSDQSPSTGHICLAFDSRADLESRARDFLAEGEAAGERIRYIASTAPSVRLPFVPLGETYPHGTIIDPLAQVAAYAAATEQALAAGYTGLRVVADATELVRTPAQLDAFARYEYRVDRYMRDHPFTALCAYDRTELDDDTIAQVACMHAESNTAVPFRLHACPPAEGSAALTGELDWTVDDLFTATLDRADLTSTDEVVLQASGLRFTDHGSLLRLQQYAQAHGTTVVLRDARPVTGRLAGMLGLSRLRVEVAR